jgi:tagatose 1,6-diphosphate aldolase GatY/KbaY
MLDEGTASLQAAWRDGLALGAFSTYCLEQTQAICDAAAAVGEPVILQAGSSTFRHAGRSALIEQALHAARACDVPVGVHLDHSRDVDEVQTCLKAGYTSVMVDGSHLPFEENVALTRRVVSLARRVGAWTEGELGAIPGDEDRSTDAAAGAFTDPARAEEFVARTRVDALAVAVGNVHGLTAEPRPLDFELLRSIRRRVAVPLVLHGASGLTELDLVKAIGLGVAKINVNTELRQAFLASLSDVTADVLEAADLTAVLGAARKAVQEVVEAKIRVLRTGHAGGAAPHEPSFGVERDGGRSIHKPTSSVAGYRGVGSSP